MSQLVVEDEYSQKNVAKKRVWMRTTSLTVVCTSIFALLTASAADHGLIPIREFYTPYVQQAAYWIFGLGVATMALIVFIFMFESIFGAQNQEKAVPNFAGTKEIEMGQMDSRGFTTMVVPEIHPSFLSLPPPASFDVEPDSAFGSQVHPGMLGTWITDRVYGDPDLIIKSLGQNKLARWGAKMASYGEGNFTKQISQDGNVLTVACWYTLFGRQQEPTRKWHLIPGKKHKFNLAGKQFTGEVSLLTDASQLPQFDAIKKVRETKSGYPQRGTNIVCAAGIFDESQEPIPTTFDYMREDGIHVTEIVRYFPSAISFEVRVFKRLE